VLRSIKGSYRSEIKELRTRSIARKISFDYEEAVTLLKQAQVVRQQLAGGPASADRVVDVRSFVQAR
jgi:hypothetical protein